MKLESLHASLLSQALLFEIQQPEPNILESTKHILKINKQLWDFVNIVKSYIEVWQSTLWKDIDFEFMDIELKRFSKDLKCIYKHLKKIYIYMKTTNLMILISSDG